jgi:hypothetical protein
VVNLLLDQQLTEMGVLIALPLVRSCWGWFWGSVMILKLLWRRHKVGSESFREFAVPVGRAIAQAVSHRLPTATAQVRARVKSCVLCSGQSGTGVGSLRADLRFSRR